MPACNLEIKLYWRRRSPEERYHCFRADRAGGGYASLCGVVRIAKPHGQDVNRPPPLLRCPRCDGAEADVHGRDDGLDDRVTHPERPLH